MTNRSILLVEGSSDAAVLHALDRSIVMASARRETYSLLHELAHQALAYTDLEFNKTDMSVFFERYQALIEGMSHVQTDLRPVSIQVKWSGYVSPPPADASLTPRMPDWYSNTFTRMTAPRGFCAHGTENSAAPTLSAPDPESARSEPPRISYRLTTGTLSFLANSSAAVVRLSDRVIGALLLMRMLVRTGLSHRPNARAFVLLILATCRRYGRRSEPDDHASLLIRRHLVSMGSRPQA
jgi:hypothetical protein